MRWHLFLLILLLLGACFGNETMPEVEVPSDFKTLSGTELYQQVCAHCHGKKGEGHEALKGPSIAGLPKWYGTLQINNFRKGYRGLKRSDSTGRLMREIALSLDRDSFNRILSYVESLSPVANAPTVKGNVEKGKKLFKENCMDCHRYNASGELSFKSAPLVYFQDWYLKEQLQKFDSGLRAYHPRDEVGKKMQTVFRQLHENVNIDDVLAYLHSLNQEISTK